jgi:hypothetical protein
MLVWKTTPKWRREPAMLEFDEMSDDQSGETTSKRPLTTVGVVIRLGAIGVAGLCVAGAFAYTGGWLSPRPLTEDRMLAAFTDAEGLHPGSSCRRGGGKAPAAKDTLSETPALSNNLPRLRGLKQRELTQTNSNNV